MSASCCHTFSHIPSLFSPPNCRSRVLKLSKASVPLNRTSGGYNSSSSKPFRNKWRFSCFRQGDTSSEFLRAESTEDKLPEELVNPQFDQSNVVKSDWISNLRKATKSVFGAEPWTVPWKARTIVQVMLLWIASFWLVGSWIVPFLAHATGYRKESLSYRGQALYSLLTDVAEGLAGCVILHRCLARFRPLPSGWFRFSFKGKWQFDVGLGYLLFPLVNRLSQVNLNLLPILPSTPVTVSNVEQSIVARDPVAMALYAIVVSVCAPVWEEIVFRGFLLPSLTRWLQQS
ncbi:unnamed protein product [Ilex paraguariensis]|uniref:CAAX prenyl protease 2/Lysostaphin resistance protein A-like domain-containing protein n=1 Tax=Ilex paraguariensis TaxID=185542 RepID=A0ABC8UVK0_9AQUA